MHGNLDPHKFARDKYMVQKTYKLRGNQTQRWNDVLEVNASDIKGEIIYLYYKRTCSP